MYEFTTVVVKRSYSLISGQTSEDILTSTSGKYFNKNSFSSFSFLEFAYECRKPIPILSNFSFFIVSTKL